MACSSSRHAAAEIIHVAEILIGFRIAAVGGALEQLRRAHEVARHALAFEIEIAEIARRLGLSLRRRAAVPVGGLREILIDPPAFLEIGAHGVLRAGMILLGRGAEPIGGGFCIRGGPASGIQHQRDFILRLCLSRFGLRQEEDIGLREIARFQRRPAGGQVRSRRG